MTRNPDLSSLYAYELDELGMPSQLPGNRIFLGVIALLCIFLFHASFRSIIPFRITVKVPTPHTSSFIKLLFVSGCSSSNFVMTSYYLSSIYDNSTTLSYVVCNVTQFHSVAHILRNSYNTKLSILFNAIPKKPHSDESYTNHSIVFYFSDDNEVLVRLDILDFEVRLAVLDKLNVLFSEKIQDSSFLQSSLRAFNSFLPVTKRNFQNVNELNINLENLNVSVTFFTAKEHVLEGDIEEILYRNMLSLESPLAPIVVTGASDNHADVLQKALLTSLLKIPEQKVIVYDLGLNQQNREKISSFNSVEEIRYFNFSLYPSFFDIRVNAGEYAWKPVIIREVLEDHPIVLWLDAGDALRGASLANFVSRVMTNGVFSASSGPPMRPLTHPGTVTKLGQKYEEFDLDASNCAANVAGYYRNHPMYERIVLRMASCALEKDCIAPPGSSRANHRQDQTVLTVLVLINGLSCTINPEDVGIAVHQDSHVK
jgi:Protein of unknown function (DUF1647)